MKIKFLSLVFIVLSISRIIAQSSDGISYQAIARDPFGLVLPSKSVSIKFTIIENSATGNVVYVESHAATTNSLGLFTLYVGKGTPITGLFNEIKWNNGDKFLKVELDINGGTNYIEMGTSPLQSVPFSLYAKEAGNISWTNITNKPIFATFSGSYFDLTNKPIIPASFSGSYLDLSNKPSLFSGSYNDLTSKPTFAIVATTGSYNDLTNKPIIPASFSGSYLDLTNKPVIINNTFTGSYTDLTNKLTFAVVATTGSYNDLTNKPIIPASFSGSYLDLTNKPVIINNTFTGSYTDLTNKLTFAVVATTGSYNDLTNKPIIPASFSGSYLDLTNKPVIINNTFTGSYADLTNKLTFAVVATTGSYNDLTNKPIIPASFSGSYLDLTNKPVIVNNTFTGSYTDLTNKLTFAVVATTGSYNDLTNKPIIPASFSGSYLDLTNKPIIINNTFTGSYTDLTNKLTFAVVATTGSYNDLTNKPVLTTLTGGSGITVNGTNQIINTLPDVPITLTGVNVTITGSYPAFTVTGAAPTTFSGGAGISITGSNQIVNISPMPNGTIAGQMLYWNGTAWVNIDPGTNKQTLVFCNGKPKWGECIEIGDSYQGGIVAYILQPGDLGYDANLQHGLIAASNDQSTSIQWYNGSYINTGAVATGIGFGNSNTNAIVSAQGPGSYAAQLCADLVLNGYSDWYLPSQDELFKIRYINGAVLGMTFGMTYWSSSEFDTNSARNAGSASGPGINDKSQTFFRVRAVRSF